jgi:hypothetical protein
VVAAMKFFKERTRGVRVGALAAGMLSAGALAAPAQAALTVAGPADASGAASFYQDVNGLKLGICDIALAQCGGGVAGGGGGGGGAGAVPFWYQVTSTLTAGGGTAKLVMGVLGGTNAAGGPIAFNRLRVDMTGFPDGTYSVTTPYGVDTVGVAGGTGKFRVDVGCNVVDTTPCNFAGALAGRIGPFVTPDPATVIPSPGFLSDGVNTTKVVGSPTGTNWFGVQGAGVSGRTDDFLVRGALSGAPVPMFESTGTLAFGSQIVNTAGAAKTITVRNVGIAGAGSDLTVSAVTLGGANAADYSITADTCTGTAVVSGGTCSVTLGFTPGAVGGRAATLTIADNTAAATHTMAVSGTGAAVPVVAPPVVAPAPAQVILAAPRLTQPSLLRLTRLTVPHTVKVHAAKRGVRISLVAPPGTSRVRVQIYRVGKSGRTLIASHTQALTGAGSHRLTLTDAALRKAGTYAIDVAVGRATGAFGAISTGKVRIVR